MVLHIHKTDDIEEMTVIGKRIVEDNPEFYTKNMIRSSLVKIGRVLRDADSKERQTVFFRSVYDYWVYGTNQSEELFYDFLHMTDEQKQEYITFRNRFDYYYQMNERRASHILNNKFETYEKFRNYFGREIIQIVDERDFNKFCDFSTRHPEFVVKPSSLGLTIGVYKVRISEWSNRESLFNEILRKGAKAKKENAWKDSWTMDQDSSVILEELIDQDEAMARIHPVSVNGVRISTIYTGDHIEIFYPWLKIGAAGKFITAEAFGSLMAGIDAETGIVDTSGIDESGKIFDCHPDTYIKIAGYVIPGWNELVETVTELAKQLHNDGINYVGWDMALTRCGWRVIEGNFDGEFLGQLVYHKGVKKELEQLIGWKPQKEFWWQ